MAIQTLDEALANLRAATLQVGTGTVKVLDQALADVTRFHDPKSIGPILLLLNDNSDHDEGMFSLIHAAEAFDDDMYVGELLAVLPKIRVNSPKWASIVLMRAINNQKTKDVLVRILRDAPIDTKESAAWLCEKINERSPSFLSKTVPVLFATQ
jgi:hypothetical protein